MSNWIALLIGLLYIFQVLSLIAVVFIENKDPVSTMSWVMILNFLPILGFILYLFLGRGLTLLASKKLKLRHKLQLDLQSAPPRTSDYFTMTKQIMQNETVEFTDPRMAAYTGNIKMNYQLSQAAYTQNNDLTIYVDGKSHYQCLFSEIEAAKASIHVCYFIISDTKISHEFIALLAKKAGEGVHVRLIYDELGNLFVPNRKLYRPLKEAGGEVYSFFPLKGGNLLHANYRNHHKIVVIDGEIGYTGGMNIGDEYMGLHKRKTPWRDTHMRLTGDVVASLQLLFLLDLHYATNGRGSITDFFDNRYFPMPIETGEVGVQLVSSGPDDSSEAIKRAMIKMISGAKKTIYIQSPYLMPDQPVMEAIQIAASSGVEIILMLPGIPDKKIVYHVTYSYIQNMLDYGVKVYLYSGFLHSKMIVVDDEIATIGTTNLDMRSFSYHFEVNSFIYDSQFGQKCTAIFQEDLTNCTEMTRERYNKRSGKNQFLERIFRLFAPLM